MSRWRSRQRATPPSLIGVLMILWLVRARYKTFLHTYVRKGSIPNQVSQFPSHLLPPSFINVYFSALKTEKLLVIPNLVQSGARWLKSHLNQILCSDPIQNAKNLDRSSCDSKNSFHNEFLHINRQLVCPKNQARIRSFFPLPI